MGCHDSDVETQIKQINKRFLVALTLISHDLRSYSREALWIVALATYVNGVILCEREAARDCSLEIAGMFPFLPVSGYPSCGG